MSARKPLPRRAQRGLSIVELMVGIVVAMLVGLAAAGSAIVFTAAQRQGVGIGSAGLGSATALSAIKNDVALAGLGFFGDSTYLCEKLDLSMDADVLLDGSDFAPVQITAEASGDDRIDIVYADRIESGANVLLKTDSDGTTAQTQSLLPVAANQAVLLTPADGSGTCLVRTVTAVAASTEDTPQTLTFDNTGKHNKAAFTAAPAFAERDRIALLGEISWNRYRRIDNTLVLERPMDDTSAVIARNVIGLRAQYGIAAAAAGSTTLEDWQDATGGFAALDAATLPRVRAVRLGIVTRSPQKEKPNTDGDCEASLTKPTLFGATVEPDVADWQCYRYRSTVVVVPLRNLVLGLKS
jgi:type IV pilus assembly protein PilW